MEEMDWKREWDQNKDWKIEGPKGDNSFIMINLEKLAKAQQAIYLKHQNLE